MKISITLIILLTILLTSPATLNAGNDAPYIYYHAYDENAFIAERADGSDRFTLFEYELLETPVVLGDGWSPDGRYFAWYGTEFWRLNVTPLFVFDSVEGKTVSLFGDEQQILATSWEESRNLLLVVARPMGSFENMVIDVNDNFAVLDSVPDDVQWRNRTVLDNLYNTPYGTSRRLSLRSNDGLMTAHFHTNGITIESRQNENTIEIATPASRSVAAAFWSGSNEYILFFSQHDNPQAWLVSIEVQTVTQVAEAVEFNGFSNPWIDNSNLAWLMDANNQIAVFDASATEKVSLGTFESQIVRDARFHTESEIIFILSEYDTSQSAVYLYNTATNEFKMLVETEPDTWVFDWSINPTVDTLVIFGTWSLRKLQELSDQILTSEDFFYHYYDIGTQKLNSQLPLHSDALSGEYFSELQDISFIWDMSGTWLLTGIRPSNLSPFYSFSVSKNDGSNYRELSAGCYIAQPSCIGWLP